MQRIARLMSEPCEAGWHKLKTLGCVLAMSDSDHTKCLKNEKTDDMQHLEFYGLLEMDKSYWFRCLVVAWLVTFTLVRSGGSLWPKTLLMVLVTCLSVLLVLTLLISFKCLVG